MLNTVRFGAVVDVRSIEKFKEAVLVSHIDPVKGELNTRQEKINAMLQEQIKVWQKQTESYPDSFIITLGTENSSPMTLLIKIQHENNATAIGGWKQLAFNLHLGKNGRWLKGIGKFFRERAYRTGRISPEKHLERFLKKADESIQRFIKENP